MRKRTFFIVSFVGEVGWGGGTEVIKDVGQRQKRVRMKRCRGGKVKEGTASSSLS